MGIFREWIQNVVVFLLLMTMAGQLIPDEKYKKYIRLTMGLLLIMVILLPLTRLTGMDAKIYQNFIQESFRVSAADAQAGEEIVGTEGKLAEGYKQMIEEEIRLYFEADAMILKYCDLDVDADAGSKSYGQIYRMKVGIMPKDRDISGVEASANRPAEINIGEIKVGENLEERDRADGEQAGEAENGNSEVSRPKEKIEQWKQDLSLQFGIDEEQLELEILS